MDEIEMLEACGYIFGETPEYNSEEEEESSAPDIKLIRQNLGLSQAKFAKKLTIPLRTLQSWETGERHCPAYIIRLIEHWATNSTSSKGDWL